MRDLSLLSNSDLIRLMPRLVGAERACAADVIEHLVEIRRRRLFLDQACSSLSAYCVERLGYSEDEATKRVRVARLAGQFPGVLEELRAGRVNLTGLFLLAGYLTADNYEKLVGEARGKSRRQIEMLVASWFPKPDIPDHVGKVPEQLPVGELAEAGASREICPGTDLAPRPAGSSSSAAASTHAAASLPMRLEPLSATRWSVQFTASAEFQQKLERAQELLSHVVPSGSLATIFERALDALIECETKRREGAGKPRKKRTLRPGSRHIPVDVARSVRERDGNQCAFVDEHGRRCAARRFLTIEHKNPFARGGEPTVENLCLLCAAHNHDAARKVFGDAHVESRISERRTRKPARLAEKEVTAKTDEVIAKTHSALTAMGFSKGAARAAVGRLVTTDATKDIETMLRAALALLVPPARTNPRSGASAF